MIKGTLEEGNDIKFSGFGNFTLREKVARPGRNPKTGKMLQFQKEEWLPLNLVLN